jgi:molecular chaperone Hsp33
MPGVTEETIAEIETVISNLEPITTLYEAGESPETLFERLSNHTGVILDKRTIQYKCPCSYEGFLTSLSTLSKEALVPLADEDHGAHITCHFCKKEYNITESDIRLLIEIKTS